MLQHHLPPPILQGEVAHLLAGRAPHERVRAFVVLAEPFAVEDGTLTRTMKPRKARQRPLVTWWSCCLLGSVVGWTASQQAHK